MAGYAPRCIDLAGAGDLVVGTDLDPMPLRRGDDLATRVDRDDALIGFAHPLPSPSTSKDPQGVLRLTPPSPRARDSRFRSPSGLKRSLAKAADFSGGRSDRRSPAHMRSTMQTPRKLVRGDAFERALKESFGELTLAKVEQVRQLYARYRTDDMLKRLKGAAADKSGKPQQFHRE